MVGTSGGLFCILLQRLVLPGVFFSSRIGVLRKFFLASRSSVRLDTYNKKNDMSDEFPFVRITVLGATRSGKTCLIHSFVNNHCPLKHTPTEFPA